ncbi:hypothetical protein JNB_14253 [Janibacter sp. HTCC2649]|uniref:hypothetical protein n=1 Tax=Janibacter sp. HTCC2649 TaxID=313589 RepID=UPI0000671948|nr:hypothetical protein [Janibacter sp. HTCC2649]EAP98133.1 hypothetical protein JNB_14253 [Janibacter sp. HTCC2649]
MNRRFEFAFAPAYRLPALILGIRPRTAHVTVTADELRVRFGPWRLVTPLTNIATTEITGNFGWLKTAGPPHLSFADRGVTFATNGERALCVRFLEPVAGIDPTRTIKHPGATLTVADPESLQRALA